MSTFIHHELFLLLRTIAVGAVLLLCYDLLAAFRNVFAHSDKAVGRKIFCTGFVVPFLFFRRFTGAMKESCVFLWF